LLLDVIFTFIDGQLNNKGTAFAEFAFNVNFPLVTLYHGFYQNARKASSFRARMNSADGNAVL